jgi:uridylate kinase
MEIIIGPTYKKICMKIIINQDAFRSTMDTLVISMGGSLIAPDKPDHFMLREFKAFCLGLLDKYNLCIVCGGGRTNSYYNEAATRVSNITKEDLDWIGIMATRLNAELVRSIFGKLAGKVIYDPTKKISKKKILVAAGWKPGWSTDYVAASLAIKLGAKQVLNLTNIRHVYDRDPRMHKDAKPLMHLSWKEYRKLVGSKWTPRMSSPFDPVASRLAEQNRIKVTVLDGKDLKNASDYLEGAAFEGTVIE